MTADVVAFWADAVGRQLKIILKSHPLHFIWLCTTVVNQPVFHAYKYLVPVPEPQDCRHEKFRGIWS